MLQKVYFSNKYCSFELFIYQRIKNDFLKDRVTLKTGVMAAENSALQSQE